MKTILFVSASALALIAAPARAQEQQADSGSGLDTLVTDDTTADAAAEPAKTGDPVVDRLNALEARIRQLEARNAQLEAAAVDTQSRVERVEVRSAKAARPGVVPTFADVNDNFTFKPRGASFRSTMPAIMSAPAGATTIATAQISGAHASALKAQHTRISNGVSRPSW